MEKFIHVKPTKEYKESAHCIVQNYIIDVDQAIEKNKHKYDLFIEQNKIKSK